MASKTDQSVFTTNLLTDRATTGTDGAVASVGAAKTYQASGATSSGTGSATIQVEGSNDTNNWDVIGTITLTLGTSGDSDSFTSDDRYAQVRGNVTAISGTGASVDLVMSA